MREKQDYEYEVSGRSIFIFGIILGALGCFFLMAMWGLLFL